MQQQNMGHHMETKSQYIYNRMIFIKKDEEHIYIYSIDIIMLTVLSEL